MQVSVGTVSVTNNSNRVISNQEEFSSDWSVVAVGSWFTTSDAGHNVTYQVAQLLDPATSVSGFWEVLLSTPYLGATNAAAFFAITNDFTSYGAIPLLNRGDAESATIFSRAMQTIASILSAFNTRITTLESTVTPAAPSAVSTITLPTSGAVTLSGGKHYRLECVFSTYGTFSDVFYESSISCSDTNVQISRNENTTTAAKGSWNLYAPTTYSGITFSGKLKGVFTPVGNATLNSSQASWSLTQLD